MYVTKVRYQRSRKNNSPHFWTLLVVLLTLCHIFVDILALDRFPVAEVTSSDQSIMNQTSVRQSIKSIVAW